MRASSVLAFLITAGWASAASAQVIATDPEPAPSATVARGVHSVPDHVTPEPEPVWYGDDILIAGAVTSSVMMIGVSMLAASDGDGQGAQAGAAIAGLGYLGHVISGPALHGAAVGGWRTWVSVSTRVGLGLGIPGVAAGICGAQGGCDHAGPILATTFAAGTVIPVAIDAAIAWRPPTPADRRELAVIPYATPTPGGAAAGLIGQF